MKIQPSAQLHIQFPHNSSQVLKIQFQLTVRDTGVLGGGRGGVKQQRGLIIQCSSPGGHRRMNKSSAALYSPAHSCTTRLQKSRSR